MTHVGGVDSIGQNVRGLLTQAERLARTEMELAIAKGKESVSDTARHVGVLAVAGVFALGGTAFLLHAIYSLLTRTFDPWLAALLTAAIAFAAALVLLWIAVHRKTEVPIPDTTDGRRVRVTTAR